MSEITPAQILEALNDKADRDLMNVATGADVVVEYQMPNANNGYTWYRKYASGWVEQGGVADYGSQATDIAKIQVDLPITMSDNRYYATEMPVRNDMDGQSNGLCAAYVGVFDRHTTYFCVRAYCGNTNERLQLIQWEVKGMAATVS